jgi:hypothetical protein
MLNNPRFPTFSRCAHLSHKEFLSLLYLRRKPKKINQKFLNFIGNGRFSLAKTSDSRLPPITIERNHSNDNNDSIAIIIYTTPLLEIFNFGNSGAQYQLVPRGTDHFSSVVPKDSQFFLRRRKKKLKSFEE